MKLREEQGAERTTPPSLPSTVDIPAFNLSPFTVKEFWMLLNPSDQGTWNSDVLCGPGGLKGELTP